MKKSSLSALLVGLIFGVGLGISGMTKPSKVIAFLDVFGNWDPSLLFVMLGAVSVHSITYRMVRKRSTPLLSDKWHIPDGRKITPALIWGGFIFGIGWGLAGYCPGPAVASLASLQSQPFVFVLAMIAGMLSFRIVDKKIRFRK